MDIETELLYAARMLVAALIGGLIGWERERHASDAGIRTFRRFLSVLAHSV